VLAQHAARKRYLLGARLTYADLSLFQVIAGLNYAFPNACSRPHAAIRRYWRCMREFRIGRASRPISPRRGASLQQPGNLPPLSGIGRAGQGSPVVEVIKRGAWAPLTQGHPHGVRAAVVGQDDGGLARQLLAIQFDSSDAAAHAIGVVDLDLIARGGMPENDVEVRPVRRYARRQQQFARRTRNPRIHSRPARYIQLADPVYHVQPPRPTWGATE